MSANSANESFLGYAGFLLIGALLSFPAIGWSGIFGAIVMIYFCLVMTNGAGTADKRRRNRR